MISRRFFVASGGALLCVPVLRAQTSRYHFTLGVASGSPRDTQVVLWTRLAPVPLEGGGMPPGTVNVRYRLCADEAMKRTVREGLVPTSESKAHSVHAVVQGLEPGREYWYQFYYGEDESPVGRTRTTSARDRGARIALTACQHWETGYYAGYADMAAWAPDVVIQVGDYMYEGAASAAGTTLRRHNGAETVTLWDYRNRYALYRSDPQLQAAHAASPWLVAFDDHELDNNFAADVPQDPWAQTPLEFKVRKLAAFQAYYEHMPLERPPVVRDLEVELRLYDAHRFGPAQVHLLDTRQYRSDQVCGQGFPASVACEALEDPARTLTGAAQERWLLEELRRSEARYNVLAQQIWFAPFRYNPTPGPAEYNMDQWDGYPRQRARLLEALAAGRGRSVVLSGDWHCAAAMELHRDPLDPKSPLVGHEFAATSMSSRCPWADRVAAAKPANPHVSYVNGNRRGYLRCSVDERGWTSTYRVVENPDDARSAVTTDHEIRI